MINSNTRPSGATHSIETHPIYIDDAILATRALEECVNVIKHWSDNLLPGGIVYAEPRHGKTFMIDYVLPNIHLIFGRAVPVANLIAWPHGERVSETRFYHEMLRSLKYAYKGSRHLYTLRARTINFMEQKARDLGSRTFVLFIDEAQELALAVYRYLINLHKELKRLNIRLFVILVGQPELKGRYTTMAQEKRREIIGRFMTGIHELTGIRDLGDLIRAYQTIDTRSEYPLGSGITYTQYFLPEAYEHGWRLATHAPRIWERIRQIVIGQGLHFPNQISMQAVMSLTRWLLSELHPHDCADLELTDQFIDEAIHVAAFLQLQTDAMTGSSRDQSTSTGEG